MKINWLKIVNPLLGIAFFFQMIIGVFNDHLPAALFENLHETGAAVLLSLAIVHIYLNRNWIKMTFFKKK